VARDLEPGGGHAAEVPGTAFQFVDLAARAAMEVMMVGLAGEFVAGRLAGEFDDGQPPLLHQPLHIAVDRRHAQPLTLRLGSPQDLIHRQGPAGRLEDSPDGVALFRFSDLHWSVPTSL